MEICIDNKPYSMEIFIDNEPYFPNIKLVLNIRINIMSQILFYGEYVHFKKNSMGFHIFFDPILWDFIFFSTLFYGKIAPKLPYMNRS